MCCPVQECFTRPSHHIHYHSGPIRIGIDSTIVATGVPSPVPHPGRLPPADVSSFLKDRLKKRGLHILSPKPISSLAARFLNRKKLKVTTVPAVAQGDEAAGYSTSVSTGSSPNASPSNSPSPSASPFSNHPVSPSANPSRSPSTSPTANASCQSASQRAAASNIASPSRLVQAKEVCGTPADTEVRIGGSQRQDGVDQASSDVYSLMDTRPTTCVESETESEEAFLRRVLVESGQQIAAPGPATIFEVSLSLFFRLPPSLARCLPPLSPSIS